MLESFEIPQAKPVRAAACRLTAILAAAALLSLAPVRAEAGGVLAIDFEDADFTNPLVIDNPYWPLQPDDTTRTFTFEAETEDGCVIEEATVYDSTMTKTLDGAAPYFGVEAIMVEDIGYIDENCDGTRVRTEHTFDWYIQDDNGNIWYVGELSREYEGDCAGYAGDPSEADRVISPECYVGSWEAGKGPAGGLIAQAGIVVPSDFPVGPGGPALTAGTYFMQELAEDAVDVAKVLKVDTKVKFKTEGGTTVFQGCRVTKEYTALSPGAVEQKNYCPDDGGLVLIEETSGGKSVFVVLTDVDPPL